SEADDIDLKPYSLAETIRQKIIKRHSFNGSWISQKEFLYQSSDKNINLFDCEIEQNHRITQTLDSVKYEIVHFDISSTREYLLLVAINQRTKLLPQKSLECDPSLEYYLYNLQNQ
ncbi:hypothetical protein QR98_0100020, partial [Sarcoptes scabiei]